MVVALLWLFTASAAAQLAVDGQLAFQSANRATPENPRVSTADTRPVIASGRTTFEPTQHGFKFSNGFQSEFLDARSGGLCGGMAYAALDYFKARRAVPTQYWKPANGTPLYNYIYDRQRHSLENSADKWAEFGSNVFGHRNREFFNWGLQQTNGGRVAELKSEIDQSRPVPLGLYKGGTGSTGDHQVLAIGYELGDRPESLVILIYDSNHPGKTMELVPDVAQGHYRYRVSPYNETWMAYYVDRKHQAYPLPAVTNYEFANGGLVKNLLLRLHTGIDDLRGGNDNINLTISYRTRPPQVLNNINQGGNWIQKYEEWVPITLARPVSRDEIMNLTFNCTFGGGIGGDNWDMQALTVKVLDGSEGQDRVLFNRGGTEANPLFRFTGDRLPFTAQTRAGLRPYTVKITTGGDDLRDGSQAFFRLNYRNGNKSQEFPLNGSTQWNNFSTQTVVADLGASITPEMIFGITIRHDGEPRRFPDGYDNWDIGRVQVMDEGGTVLLDKSGTPLIRFTGAQREQFWRR
ncbi:MAG: hypothetical protein H7319_02200 [Spirosoma sp.]|nr:hypothetical protein [Spirosoma sp.]